jgi:hypothetical protein
MTTADRIKATADYFNLELSEYDKQKLSSIWYQEPKIIIKEKLKLVQPKEPNHTDILAWASPFNVDLLTLLKRVCAVYGISFKLCFKRNRKDKVVQAKVHFARLAKIDNRALTSVELADFLQCDHSTILYYWYDSKAEVGIKPLTPNNRIIKNYKAA